MAGTGKRGFASMDDDMQKDIARKGGKAAHAKGTAHEFTREEAREAGRKGGETVSEDREHMAKIGRKGGETVSEDREHMAEIGRKGGESRGEPPPPPIPSRRTERQQHGRGGKHGRGKH